MTQLFFNTTSLECQVNCSSLPNTTQWDQHNGWDDSCYCVAPLIWSDQFLNCGNYTCKPNFDALPTGCQLNCTLTNFSNGSN